jgi:hypothetical protein
MPTLNMGPLSLLLLLVLVLLSSAGVNPQCQQSWWRLSVQLVDTRRMRSPSVHTTSVVPFPNLVI